MEFNSFAYAAFFAIVIALYYAPFMRTAVRQNALVLAASYAFYGAWDWRFLGLIMLTTVSTYLSALAIADRRNKGWLVANIVLNLGILGLFKYFNFFSDNIAWLLKWMGWEVDWVFIEILLPVGISFYTFQAIGYTIDVWRKEIQPERNLLFFATFIAYFPQLVAGPIERAGRLLPQLKRLNVWQNSDATAGMRLILWGMLKKVAVADPCGTVVAAYFDAGPDYPNLVQVYVGALCFAIQIYCDFSGYCDIAQGSARIMGVRLTDNFLRPFFSRSFLELWHRWHVSLMRWFTNYVYIPLGGSRCGRWRTMRNIMIVFLLSGLWHGAAWGFIWWGLLCGVIYIVEKLAGVSNYRHAAAPKARDAVRIFATFSLFVIVFTIFRVNDTILALRWIATSILPISLVLLALLSVAVFSFKKVCDSLPKLKRLLQFRIILITITFVFAAGAIAAPQPVWFHLYYFVAAMVLLCEWRTRDGVKCPFPLSCSRSGRYATYLLFYLLILTYGFFQLPPLVSETTFVYFQF